MTPTALLADLVAIPSVCGTPTAAIAGYIQAALEAQGLSCHIAPGPEGDRVNLFATIGPADRPGIVLSGHMDVVPADPVGWTADPFRLVQHGGRLTGRGAVDMKGFLACMIAVVPDLCALPLQHPVHLAFSYDEELGCRGVPHLLDRIDAYCAPPQGCIVGEPSDLQPVLSHKGKVALELGFTGRSGHSSTPALGVNAIDPAVRLAAHIGNRAAALAGGSVQDPRFDPPHSTLQVGTIRRGQRGECHPQPLHDGNRTAHDPRPARPGGAGRHPRRTGPAGRRNRCRYLAA